MRFIIVLYVFAAVCVYASALENMIDCGNDLFCPDSHVCNNKGSGAVYACAKTPNICEDIRYSCPQGLTCNADTHQCDGSGFVVPMLENDDAKYLESGDTSTCSILNPVLPSFCSCNDTSTAYGAELKCDVNVLNQTNIILYAEVEPCAQPFSMAIEVQDPTYTPPIDFKYSLSGETPAVDIPIPGLIIGIPVLANIQVELGVMLSGNIAALQIHLGIDVCAEIVTVEECGKDITDDMPLWIIKGTYDFSSVCKGV